MEHYFLSVVIAMQLISCQFKNNSYSKNFLKNAELKIHSEKKILYKDDFEIYENTNQISDHWDVDGNVKITDSMSFSGKKSLQFTSGEGFKNRAFIYLSKIFPLTGNSFYGSMQFYIEEASPNGIHWTMIQASGKVKNKNYTSEVRFGGQHNKQFMANYDTQGLKTDCWQHSTTKIREGKWTKYQWYFNGENNTMKLWVDDILLEDIVIINSGEGCLNDDTNGKWIFPVFDTLSLGWVDYQTGGGKRKFWIDDVVIWQE